MASREFPKARPLWLVNDRGNRMELDGYCKTLGIAFEHHGEQHYSAKNLFSRTEADLERRQADDRLKRTLCVAHGVTLIEVPEILGRLLIEDVKEFIKG